MLKNNRSYSLVELLVVTSMLGVISLAIFSTFNNGMKVWQKVNKHLSGEEIGIFFDKLSRDTSSCLKNANVAFSGDHAGLRIPAPVYSRQSKVTTVGQAIYLFDSSSGRLLRQEKDYSQVYGRAEEQGTPVLGNLRSFELEYYSYDTQKQEYVWKDQWSGPGFPLAVRAILEFNDTDGEKIVRTFSIPIAG